MRTKLIFLLCCLTLTISNIVFADELETEIQLFEIIESGYPIGDDPLGNPKQEGYTPPRPTDFHATIEGRTLAISVDNENMNTAIVRNSAGTAVINQQFVGYNAAILTSAGDYTIEIYNSSLTLVGQFSAE